MKKILTICSVFLITLCCYGNTDNTNLPRGKEDPRVAAAAAAFHQAMLDIDTTHTTEIRSFMLVRKGKVVYEKYCGNETPQTPREMYSIGKTLVALAMGCAVDEGKLSLSDRVIDFFPDMLPAQIPDGMKDMTLRHLLTMTCGMEETPTLLSIFNPSVQGKDTINWVREFFASPMPHKPGTYFYYNLFATHIVCAIVEKATGMPFIDYITPRLLAPLHIKALDYDKSPQGVFIGAWGVRLCAEEMAKIGQLMLQHGKWEGHQLISRRWMKQMTNLQVPSALHIALEKNTPKPKEEKVDPNEIHSQGYGYFVWRGTNDTYRAEGQFGQVILVHPKTDTVLVLTNYTKMYKEFYELIEQYLYPIL